MLKKKFIIVCLNNRAQDMFAWILYVHIYWHQFLYHIWWSPKSLKMFTESILTNFDDLHMRCQIYRCEPHYINLFFFVNLLHSHYINFSFSLWTSSIVQVFDFLIFDIFLTIWHLLTSWPITLNHLSPSQGSSDRFKIHLFFVLMHRKQLWSMNINKRTLKGHYILL